MESKITRNFKDSITSEFAKAAAQNPEMAGPEAVKEKMSLVNSLQEKNNDEIIKRSVKKGIDSKLVGNQKMKKPIGKMVTMVKGETEEATGAGSAGGFEAPLFSEPKKLDSMFKDEQPKTKIKGGFVYESEEVKEKWSEKYKKSIDCKNPKGFSQRAHCQGKAKKVETKEATGSGSSGSFEGPSFGAKSMSPKDWRGKSKTQIPGGKFVEVKKKCKKFPYCNQGDINALKLTENPLVKQIIKNLSKEYNINESSIKKMLIQEMMK
jgi:hypothetical protein